MDILQKILEQQIQENLTFPLVGAKLIKRKLEAHGIALDEDDLRNIEERLHDNTDDLSSLIFNIDSSHLRSLGKNDDKPFTIDLSDSEGDAHLAVIMNEFYDRLGDAVPEIVNEITKPILTRLKRDAPSILRAQKKDKKQFGKGFLRSWKKPLDLLEVLILLALEAGDDFNREFRQEASKKQNYVFEVTARLHARAC